MILDVEPIGKPRQTQSDKWKKRPVVLRYRDFCDKIRSEAAKHDYEILEDERLSLTFTIPMPPSWSNRKRNSKRGQPHKQRPDIDNLLKSVMDAMLKEDCKIWWLGDIKKKWGDTGSIEIHES